MVEYTLSVAHNIFLTDEHRYAWHRGEALSVLGVSLPVWGRGGVTSEPATEVFCQYLLRSGPAPAYLKQAGPAFEMCVPPEPTTGEAAVSPHVWAALSPAEQQALQANKEIYPAVRHVLDSEDGGSRWLAFRQYNRISRGRKTVSLIHYVEVKPLSDLLGTLS